MTRETTRLVERVERVGQEGLAQHRLQGSKGPLRCTRVCLCQNLELQKQGD